MKNEEGIHPGPNHIQIPKAKLILGKYIFCAMNYDKIRGEQKFFNAFIFLFRDELKCSNEYYQAAQAADAS